MSELMGKILAGIEARVAYLSGELCLGTNEGTWSEAEAIRTVGNADPRWCNYSIWESLDGRRRVEGCDPEEAPGRMRRAEQPTPTQRKAEILRLANLAAQLRSWPSHKPLPHGVTRFAVPKREAELVCWE